MTGFTEVLITAGAFVLGLVIRLALVVLVVAAIAVPVLLALEAGQRFALLRRRLMGLGEVSGLQWRSGVHYAKGHNLAQERGADEHPRRRRRGRTATAARRASRRAAGSCGGLFGGCRPS